LVAEKEEKFVLAPIASGIHVFRFQQPTVAEIPDNFVDTQQKYPVGRGVAATCSVPRVIVVFVCLLDNPRAIGRAERLIKIPVQVFSQIAHFPGYFGFLVVVTSFFDYLFGQDERLAVPLV